MSLNTEYNKIYFEFNFKLKAFLRAVLINKHFVYLTGLYRWGLPPRLANLNELGKLAVELTLPWIFATAIDHERQWSLFYWIMLIPLTVFYIHWLMLREMMYMNSWQLILFILTMFLTAEGCTHLVGLLLSILMPSFIHYTSDNVEPQGVLVEQIKTVWTNQLFMCLSLNISAVRRTLGNRLWGKKQYGHRQLWKSIRKQIKIIQ